MTGRNRGDIPGFAITISFSACLRAARFAALLEHVVNQVYGVADITSAIAVSVAGPAVQSDGQAGNRHIGGEIHWQGHRIARWKEHFEGTTQNNPIVAGGELTIEVLLARRRPGLQQVPVNECDVGEIEAGGSGRAVIIDDGAELYNNTYIISSVR